MTPETLKVFWPCPTHGVWHDPERGCFLCRVERVEAESLKGKSNEKV